VAVKAVAFDVGETLVDETRAFAELAERLGIPALTFFGVLGGLIERRQGHRALFEMFGVEPAAGSAFERGDVYPDALPCLEALRRTGFVVGAAGNTQRRVEQFLSFFEFDFVGSSEAWGADKPSREFFTRLAEVAGLPLSEIAYVGDRVDNDVVPAADAGMVAVLVRRGPWGYLQATWPEARRACAVIQSLQELPGALRGL
jgi:FMN phosphatase YigB (HAD superfamily)